MELEIIDIEISVLSPLEISSPEKVIVGKHGIIMKNGYKSGVLLPQVAIEQGWNKEEFLRHTCYKAGMQGDCWKDPGTQIEIFTAVIFGETPYGQVATCLYGVSKNMVISVFIESKSSGWNHLTSGNELKKVICRLA